MGRSRRQRIKPGPCVLCSAVGPRTQEHVPPKNLWPKGRATRKRCLWVPACYQCNGASSQDDEYFRIVVAQGIETGEHPDVKLIESEIVRSLTREDFPGLKRSLLGRAFAVELHTEAGLFVEKRLGHMVDGKRVRRVIEKIVRGLSFLETGMIMPPSHAVSFLVAEHLPTLPVPVRIKAIEYIALFRDRPHKAGGSGNVFKYSYLQEAQKAGIASLWHLVFFDRFSVLAVAQPQEPAA